MRGGVNAAWLTPYTCGDRCGHAFFVEVYNVPVYPTGSPIVGTVMYHERSGMYYYIGAYSRGFINLGDPQCPADTVPIGTGNTSVRYEDGSFKRAAPVWGDQYHTGWWWSNVYPVQFCVDPGSAVK